MVDKGDFVYHGDHLICPQGTPRQGPASLSFPTTDWHLSVRGPNAGLSVLSHQGELPPTPAETTLLHLDDVPSVLPARQGTKPDCCLPEGASRASHRRGRDLRLPGPPGIGEVSLKGLWKVDCEGYIASLAHNVKKMVRRLGDGIGPPDRASPNAGTIAGYETTMIDWEGDPTAPARYSPLVNWPVIYLRPFPR